MGEIFFHQLHSHLRSLRVQLCLAVVLLFYMANGLIYSWRLESQIAVDASVQADVERRFDNVQTVADAAGSWYRAINSPAGSEFICEGGFDWFWGSMWFSPRTLQYPFWNMGRDVNFWMTRFENTDWVLIVRIVLSFLCIVLAYDGISGEAERGTLRLVLANSISRAQVLVAKYLASLAILFLGVALGSVMSLLILSATDALDLASHATAGWALFLATTVAYLSLFLFLALGVSALTRSSVSSLVLLTLVWAVLTIVVPQSSYLVAMQAVEVPLGWSFAPGQMAGEVTESLERDGLILRDPMLAVEDDFAAEQRIARLMRESEKDQRRLGKEGLAQQLRRFQVARAVNLLSPGYAFQYTVEALMGTGVAKRQSYLRQCLDYIDTVRDFLRARDAVDPDSPHILFLPRYMSQAPLDGALIPRFQERPLSLAESATAGMVPFTILIAEALASLLFALWAINRADLTGYAVEDQD